MRKLQLDAKSRDILFRAMIAFAMLFGTVLLQTSFFPALDLFGSIPDILMVFVVGVAFFDGLRVGLLVGIGGGMLSYFLGSVGVAIPILFYAFCGGLAGYTSRRLFGRNYLSWCMVGASFCLIKAFWSIAVCLIGSAAPAIGRSLVESILPEMLGNAILFLISYYPMKPIARLLRRKSDA